MRWRTHTPLPTDRQYTGQRWDADLGLYDYRARTYDPALGRFIQPDTVVPEPGDPQSLNRYAYVLNNPLRYNDPSGHCPWCIGTAIGAVVGAVVGAATAAVPQMIQNVRDGQPLTANIDPGEVGKAAVAGAVAGAVVGGTLGWGASAVGLVGAGEGGTALVSSATAMEAGATAEAAATAACADGDCTNEVAAAEQTGLEVFERAQEFGIRPYNELRKLIKGTGLEAHHIVEQRFADILEVKPHRMLSVALKPEEHQVFTNMWRKAIGYSNSLNPINTTTATAEDIWDAAQSIYAKIPALLDAARRTIFGE